ncbi:GDP-mannose 4,6-dehydratase [Rhodococcus pyridinivorans]|uniref:GDP-mannose 4,6-dehydratase n=1 Tax=Rhodococcus pyridinivorans TaxID=103816 RepID=UPI00216469DD|nr:GDP-mannose 4,6-dehydratase [Rhodococcus pyridinivorans]UVT27395.1 GDP-mannose 4,6-dehydratase [Rhodococcus pyridinivorans]
MGTEVRRAVVTGTNGQDGSYLCEQLANAGIDVWGVVRPGGAPSDPRGTVGGEALSTEQVRVSPSRGTRELDVRDSSGLRRLLSEVRPHYVFHLAGISSVAASWQDPVLVADVVGTGTVNVLAECLRLQDTEGHRVTVVNASSAEIFAGVTSSPQNESSPLVPTSPYGAAKAFGHSVAQVMRTRGLGVSNAILYNHESPRRPEKFVTRKITSTVAAIAQGKAEKLELGNISVRRDWGWAPDYVDAMVRMAVGGHSEDFVIGTGVSHSIEEFVSEAFRVVGIEEYRPYVVSNPDLVRPADAHELIACPKKAKEVLGWTATVGFSSLIERMVKSDLTNLSK